MHKEIREKNIKLYIKQFINKPSENNLKNEVKIEKNNFYFKKIINKLSRINYDKETIDNRKKQCIDEYDDLNEKESDIITFDIYNHILNNSKPWNSFKEYLTSDSKIRNNNEELFINNDEKNN